MTDVVSREQMNIVIVGHVDHGKSTVVGRLLADTGSLPQGKLDAVRAECVRTGKVFEYAFLLDALSDEQDQGITIDTARCFFKTARRDYIIIDAPGHIEFLKNMISGAARAEAAVLVIDAKEGVRENSRRHGYILGMLGIKQVVVVVNKMDLAKYGQAHFDAIEKEYREFLAGIGTVVPKQFIPIAALHGANLTTRVPEMAWYTGPTLLECLDGFRKAPVNGDNLAHRSPKTPWYKGPTLLECLAAFEKAPPANDRPLRLPVQAVYKFTGDGDDRRIFAGRIDSGRVKVGDKVVFSPSNKTVTIRSIEGFNTQPRTEIGAGWSTGFTLSEEIYVTRGEIVSHVDRAPLVSTRFRVNMIWLSRKPFVTGRDYKIKLHTQAVPVRIHRLNKVIDASELNVELTKDHVGRHDVADLVLETRSPVAFDLISESEATGRFVIVDGYDVAGGGIITGTEADEHDDFRAEARLRDFNWIHGGVTTGDRARANGHRAGLVMFVGKHGVGKRRYARALEKALFDARRQAYMLDGTNVLLGLDHDMSVDAARQELVRRFGEVVNLLLTAGLLVVSTTNAIGLADASSVQTLIGDAPSIVIEIDPSGASTANCDLRFTGDESEAHVITTVVGLLESKGLLSRL